MRHTLVNRLLAAILTLAIFAAACDGGGTVEGTPVVDRPANAVEVSIVYAPEFAPFMPDAITDFNRAFAEGRHPVTGQPLAPGERPIYVTGKDASSGTVMQGIVNAVIAPGNVNVERPTLWSPSVSHWLALANYNTGRELFDLTDSPPTALAPVVMAIWESRLNAIKAKNPGEAIGWEHLLEVLNDPDGWASYGIPGRSTVYYGHTDPYISSTALSTLIGEFYASARYNSNNPNLRRLTLDVVNDPRVQEGVRRIEQLIKHYSARTTEFKEYIAQGPEYLDFVALEENDLIYINQGKTQYQPPERLVALYPKEGTFWHEHPFAIPNADWVTPEQRAAAKVFTEYVLSKPVQEIILANGFRPASPEVPAGYPIVADLGVDPAQPATVLDVPDPAVVAAVQSSWQFVKKQADVLLLFDVSGSMSGDKIDQARQAALAFLGKLPAQNRVGLMTFSHIIDQRVPLDSFERNRDDLIGAVQSLRADGDTALFDAIIAAVDTLSQDPESERIRAIVLLSDGQDTASRESLNAMVNAINAQRQGKNPILIVPVAYGQDADINALNAIARASSTRVQSGDPESIQSVLEIISSYF